MKRVAKLLPGEEWQARERPRLPLIAAVALIILGAGCGGNAPSSSGGPPPPHFQPRAFPGDFFMRLPYQGGGWFIVPNVAYNPPLKEMFVTNINLNTVDAYSTVDGHFVGEIRVAGPAGLSFSPDFSKLVIGTITPYIYVADPAGLHVTGQIPVPASLLTTDAFGFTLMPVSPNVMADGTIFLGMGVDPQSASVALTPIVQMHLLLYDPVAGTFTSEDPGAGGLAAIPARTLDGKYLLVAGSSDGELHLFSTAAHGYIAASSQLQSLGTFLAANPNGTQFASIQEIAAPGSFNSQITFWSATLNPENTFTLTQQVMVAPFYSRDGKYLYLGGQNPVVILDTQTGTPAGYLGVSVESLSQFFEADETYHLLGATQPGGAMIVNASQFHAPGPMTVSVLSLGNPNVGPEAGGTQVQFTLAPGPSSASANSLARTTEAYFGAVPSPQDAVGPDPSSTGGFLTLTTTAPSVPSPGPVSVILTDADGNTNLLPDAYTYGPQLLRVEPNAVSSQGGDIVTVFAYGLGFFDLSDIHVTIGGTAVNMSNATLNSSSDPNNPVQSVTLHVPAGTPGWADVTLTTSNGTDTLKRGIEYLKTEATLSGGPFGFAVYDSVRDRFYLTGSGSTVAVFDPTSQSLLHPLQSSAVNPGSVLQGEALTPDDSRLLVADPADQLVVIFNLASNTSTSVKVVLPSDPAVVLSAPMTIAAASNNRAFVSLTPCITDPVREIDLATVTVQTRPDAATTCAPFVPYPEFGGSSGDGSTIVFAGNSGTQPPGPENIWRYNSSTDMFTGPVLVADAPWVGGKAAADGDGSVLALSQGVLDQRLLPLVPMVRGGLDSRLNDSGSLLYNLNNYVFVLDTRNGHQLLMLGLPNGPGPLAISPSGKKMFVAGPTGISFFELSVVPLAVGSVSPASAAPGTAVQIHGSGFVAGTAAQIGGQTASCVLIDSETLSCTVPNLTQGPTSLTLANPDGQAISTENAFLVQ